MLLNTMCFYTLSLSLKFMIACVNFVSSPFRETSNIYDGSSFCAGLWLAHLKPKASGINCCTTGPYKIIY